MNRMYCLLNLDIFPTCTSLKIGLNLNTVSNVFPIYVENIFRLYVLSLWYHMDKAICTTKIIAYLQKYFMRAHRSLYKK